jgi:hypothetical protein
MEVDGFLTDGQAHAVSQHAYVTIQILPLSE